MAHLPSTIALVGCLLLGTHAKASPVGDHADASLEARLRSEVGEPSAAPAPSKPRVLPPLPESKRPKPVPLEFERDASAGVRI